MEKATCCACQKPKATLECGLCKEAICKYCAQFIAEDQFSFLTHIPEELAHTTYCHSCYDNKISTEVQSYNDIMDSAKNIMVFFKKQGKETRLVKRLEEPITVPDCADRDETIMRLAFFAVQANYNAIIDVDISSVKVKDGNYQKTKWSGTAIPAHVRPEKLIKDKSFSNHPN